MNTDMKPAARTGTTYCPRCRRTGTIVRTGGGRNCASCGAAC